MINFGVRSILLHGDSLYEERIVLISAVDEDQAMLAAEAEALEYCEAVGDCRTLKIYQGYRMDEGPVEHGSELFSLIRESELSPKKYVKHFFNTGDEFERKEKF